MRIERIKRSPSMDEESYPEGYRRPMHPFEFIPFITVLIASAFAAVSIVRDPTRRPVGSMTEVFLWIGCWALVDLIAQLESEPVEAVFLLRLTHIPAFLLSVSVVRLVTDWVPDTSERLRPLIRLGHLGAIGVAFVSITMPNVILGATATHWGGWMPRYGTVSVAFMLVGCIIPSIAAYHAWRASRNAQRVPLIRIDRLRSHAVMAAVMLSVCASLSTELVLPILQIPAPRLGALAAVLVTAAAWMQVLHRSDELSLAPQTTARAVLDELQDGVALVAVDGLIISSNPRLAAIAGRSATSLVGMPLSDLIDISLDAILSGFEDREYRLTTVFGERVPVSLSSSSVRNRFGDTHSFVVVLRDLRSVDALRRRLLTSGRLAAVGELAAGIAHEVNNPVAFIRSDLNFLRSRLAEIEAQIAKTSDASNELDVLEDRSLRIERAVRGVERIAEVVGDVRGFAHVGSDVSTAGDPEAILESAMRLARLERHDEVSLTCSTLERPKPVIAGQDLKQVLLALLRVLTVNSRAGESVRVHLVSDEAVLRFEMYAETMEGRAAAEVQRFEMAGEDVFDVSAENLGLAMAIELVDQLGGAVHVDAPTSTSLEIELGWPFEQEAGA